MTGRIDASDSLAGLIFVAETRVDLKLLIEPEEVDLSFCKVVESNQIRSD